MFEHQFQDVVQRELLRFEQFHLKHHIVPVHLGFLDAFRRILHAFPLANVVVRRTIVLQLPFVGQLNFAQRRQVLVGQEMLRLERLHRSLVRHIDLRKRLQLRKLVIVLQDVFGLQILTEEFHKGFLVRLLLDGVRIGETGAQFGHDFRKAAALFASHRIGEALQLFRVTLFEHHIFRVLVAEERNRIHRVLLQIAERHNVTEGLRRVVNAVGARKRLHQPVVAQVLVHKQRVEPRRVEAREKHAHHNEQIHLAALHPVGQIAVIVLEVPAVDAKIRLEHRVVVGNGTRQKLLRREAHRRGIERFLTDLARRLLLFVGGKRENGRHAQRMRLALLQHPQRVVVSFGRFHTAHRKHRVETRSRRGAMRFQPIVLQDVERDLADAFRVEHQLGIVCRGEFPLVAFFFRRLEFRPHVVVVHLKFQHLLVANRVGNHIRVELAPEHARRGFCARRILRKDRRARETKLIVFLELTLQIALCLTEL